MEVHSIMDLPDDCLIFIFQALDCGPDRESFGLTCHRWLRIQNITRRSLQFHCSLSLFNRSPSQSNIDISSYRLSRLLTRFTYLRSLSLSGCTKLPDSGLAQLQFSGHDLRALHMDCCFGITDNGISLISTSCPNLAVISLYRCNVTDAGLEALACSCLGLRDVNLAYCSLITDRGVSALSQRCRELQAVKVSSCRRISGTGFRGCSQTLAHIDAESCKLEPEGIMDIVSGKGLEYLNLSGLSWQFQADALGPIGGGVCERLKILNLRMCRTIGNESIYSIAKGCPLLEEWNLALCHEVKLQGWESIGRFCNNLERLHVNRCRNLCDRGFQALREGCRRLSALYISGSYRISGHTIELFKLHRGHVEIMEKEVMCIGPHWTSQ
ncbi:F-box/LRR-repeat protein 12 [Punica granatum]|uniref:Uncharacterized protein n=2 Tax=Punica granatum TaxID=22663 RepID=A0A2I0JG78_PUNGR|nr:F-box/LRR-repeat protein 12 [Punica granatum]PKI55277.1 hypothetical protein CRG98_024293 [Punica granatum]